MDIIISPHLLSILVQQAAELGATMALTKTGKLKPYISKKEAFRLFGRKNIEHWIDEGLITVRKDGGHSANWRIDRMEAEALVKAYFLLRYL